MAKTNTPPVNPPAPAPGEVKPPETSTQPPAQDPAQGPTFRYRVNWHLLGFREEELNAGDTVMATEEEAAPYLGGVLTLDEPEDED